MLSIIIHDLQKTFKNKDFWTVIFLIILWVDGKRCETIVMTVNTPLKTCFHDFQKSLSDKKGIDDV